MVVSSSDRPLGCRGAVELVAEAGLVAAGHEAGARRTAIRTGDVTLREADAVPAIESMWGVGMSWLPWKPNLAPTEVVAENHEDIRLRVSRKNGQCRQEQGKKQSRQSSYEFA